MRPFGMLGVREVAVRIGERRFDLLLASSFLLMAILLAAPGVDRYGLTWDEPTYFHYAGLQREWCGQVAAGILHPQQLGSLFSRQRIAEVWLQDRARNGHPPLNELWMALAGAPFRWAGAADLTADRASITLLLGITAFLLFLLLRLSLSRLASAAGVLCYLGVPAIWAHAHLGATETMQCLFWVLLAGLLPWTLGGEERRLWVWLLVSALAFMAKFTNLLIPVWVLGTAALLGEVRRRRFWVAVFSSLVAAPLLLVILDPYFWPWQGGWGRFVDYLRQATSRSSWMPINVFYLGRGWGFHAPWHYRIVETAAALPLPFLVLMIPGLAFAARALWIGLGIAWLGREPRRAGEAEPPASSASLPFWPQILGLTGFVYALVVGLLPSTPNHDGTRQFVYIFVPAAMLAATGAHGCLEYVSRVAQGAWRQWTLGLASAAVLFAAVASFAISLAVEPWGLSYHSEWIGGPRGAWARGLELTYWMETISPKMLDRVAQLSREKGRLLSIHVIPKADYFRDAAPWGRALLSHPQSEPWPAATDDLSAFADPSVPPAARRQMGAYLDLCFARPPDAILVSYRRSSVGADFWELLDLLSQRGELELLDETRVCGVPLARLYGVPHLEEGSIPGDPQDRVWYQIPTVAALLKRQEEGRRGTAEGLL